MAQTDFTISDVLAWARTKPAGETYDYSEANHCAVAQFGRETGRPYLIGVGCLATIDPLLYEAANPTFLPNKSLDGSTFGAFAKRLEALCPETPVSPTWARLDAYMADIELALS